MVESTDQSVLLKATIPLKEDDIDSLKNNIITSIYPNNIDVYNGMISSGMLDLAKEVIRENTFPGFTSRDIGGMSIGGLRVETTIKVGENLVEYK